MMDSSTLVKDVMTEWRGIVPLTEALSTLLRRMNKAGCSFLPVGEENAVAGIVTAEGILSAFAVRMSLAGLKARPFTGGAFVLCDENTLLKDALLQMARAKAPRLVARNGWGEITGLLDIADLSRRGMYLAPASPATEYNMATGSGREAS